MSQRKGRTAPPQQTTDRESLAPHIFHGLPLPLFVFDLATLTILDVNHAAVEQYGYARDEFLAMTLIDILPQEDRARFIDHMSGRRSGLPQANEWRHKLKTGRIIDVEITSQAVAYDRHRSGVVVAQDITQRKDVEAALRKTQTLMNETQEMTRVGGWEYDTTAHRVTWTDEVYRIHAVSREYDPTDPTSHIQFYAAEDLQKLSDAFARAVQKGEPYDLVLQLTNAEGTKLWVRTIGNVEIRDGTVTRVYGNIIDVTDHTRREIHLQKLNHVLAVLSSLNYSLVQIRAIPSMLDEVCRISVDRGHFPMALIQMVDPGTRQIEPVALRAAIGRFAGKNATDLSEFQRSSGLTGSVIMTGIHAVSNDIEHDAIMLPWRDHPMRLGFRSSASLPLTASGETLGALTLYASEVGFFDEDVIEVLDQLATNISLALRLHREKSDRERAQDSLLKSERRLYQLFEEAPVGYHEIDAQGRIVSVNRTELEMLGYTSEEMLLRPVWEFIVEREMSRRAIAAKLAGSMPADAAYERTFRKKDGTELNVLVQDRALRNDRGDIVGLRATVQDMTELTKADRELRLMAQTVASAQDCISITDMENRFLFVNDAFQNTYGYAMEELVGKEAPIVMSPLTTAVTSDHIFSETLNGGWHGELVNRRKDGSDFPVELWTSVVRDQGGLPVGLVGVARDITTRRTEEEQFRQSEERFRLIAENVSEMIAVVDLDGRRVYDNPSYRSVLADPESLRGTDGFQDIHPEDRERVKQVFRDTVATGIGKRIEYRLLRRDGSVRTIDSNGSVIRDSDGRVFRVVVVSRDVTEEKILAEKSLRAQRMESIGALAGGIAHDLNNILTPIMMAIQVLRDKVPGPRGQQLLDTIELSAKRGSDMIKQVLAFGRGFKGDRILVQINHIMSDVVRIVRETFPRSIAFTADLSQDLWIVSADPTQMHQVLLNILVNARDAMPAGGTLTLSSENATVDENYSRLHPEAAPGNYVSMAISDTGTGIPEESREKIFEPFFTTKGVGMGSGLGLSTTPL